MTDRAAIRQPRSDMKGTSPRPKRSRKAMREAVWGLLLIAPAVILVVGVIAAPVIHLIRQSLTDAHAYLPNAEFVGLGNYQTLLASDDFQRSLWLTVLYAVLTVGLQTVLGVAVALLLHRQFKGRGFVRMVGMLPFMTPAIVVALVWRWLLDPSAGAYSWVISTFWAGESVPNFLSPAWIFGSLVVVSLWMYTPFVVINALARLQTIDPSTIEAAMMDGANAWKRFWYVTLPELKSVLLTLVLLRFMFMFTKFDIVYLFGGTGKEVRTLPLLTYQRIFGESRLGSGSAIAVLMFILLIIFTTIYMRRMRKSTEG